MQPRPEAMGLGKRVAALGTMTILVAACGGTSSAPTRTAPSTAAQSAPTASPEASKPTPADTKLEAGERPTNGRIVFYRTDDARSTNTPFSIQPDGTNETELRDGGIEPGTWAPDRSRLVVSHLVPDQSPVPAGQTAWQRPAVLNADGSGFRLLDAYPDRKMHLNPLGWTGDGSRIYVYGGGEDASSADMGLYTVRASDGADLTRIFQTPAGTNDFAVLSPDRSKILVNRSSNDFDRALFVVDTDGSNFWRITTPELNVVDLEFYDGVSSDWSPDGSKIAFGAQLA